ncbi:MAG TPA: TRAP transporter large permease [Aminivibrio sp.]|jgi:tripartite ATP-independent transporter DctM subunit|uniref:TRAP transporter large permease n=1 Tax=Aminivibrio sp. TaxID=1872489 RepID=UPI002B208FA7|nr:TRAP transporter large permease [Aminivibrio sp.]MDD3514734.1 TRAP transporter large permease [Synergistaceae bacterium]MEA4951560.1 TRAP transporter large permease [Aminivibrio sp.]HPF85587.1 TRAP transporter large permease [Aminivibrio sp.]
MIVGLTFALLLVLLFINAPVFAAILGSSIFYFVANDSLSWMMVVQRTISGLESIPLLAVPFFVMAGVFMNYTGITSRMIRFAEVLTGHMPGGLAQTNVVLSTLMGGLSGSSLADAAMQSKILVPEMEKRGYGKAFSSAVTGASALITPIIPPGIALIIYGFVGNVSIGRLFLAGVVPGVMTCLFMMVVVHFISKRRGYLPIYEKRAGIREVFRAFREASWALFLPVVIVGGIRFGVFTPTEAGSIAILYALVLGTIVYREMTLKDLKTGLIETVTTTASIMLIIAAASSFAWILTWERVPQITANWVLTMVSSPGVFLLLINIFLLIVGMFIEGNAAMLVLIPIFMPMVQALGINDVHFGMVFIFNMAVGSLTPPMGTVMFTTCSITGAKIGDYIRESVPFYLVLLFCLILITYVPQISLFLPNLLFN